MPSNNREKLRQFLLKAVPLDCIQRKAALEGIKKMSDKAAKEALTELESAYNALPKAVADLEKALNEYEKSIPKNKKRK